MATVNLGRIKFVWQGAYSGATAYVADDVVSYNGSSYICILASTNNLPTNATYWNLMAQTGTDITSLAGLAQGDVLYYNGTSWVRLGAGTSGQFLKTNGASANPAWANVVSGIVQVKSARQSSSESWTASNVMIGATATITPTSASNKILVMAQGVVSTSGTSVTGTMGMRYATGASVANTDTLVGGGDASSNRSRGIAWAGNVSFNWQGTNFGYHILHAPATTSQISYRLCHLGHDGETMYLGRTGRDTDDISHGRFDTNITLIEINSGVL
jgi:hypothetical protein